MILQLKTFVLLFLVTCYCALGDAQTLDIGAAAPNFNLIGIDGENYTLDSFSDADILVIIFMANHCPTSQAYEGRIMELAQDYKNKGVAVVGISSNHPAALRLDEYGYTDIGDSFEEMKQRAKDRGFNFPYLYDGDTQEAAKAFGAIATPHVFIFDKERKLKYVGRVDDGENIIKVKTHDARNAINAVLAGEKVPVEKTKVFGCSIKWKYKIESAKKTEAKMNAEKIAVEMIDIEGIKDLLKNKSDKLILVNFWSTWCAPCVAEFPELVKIFRNFRKRKFDMVTVSLDAPDKDEQVLKFLQKTYASTKNYHFKSENKYDLIESVDKNWPGALPYTILVKPGGEILYQKSGAVDGVEVRKVIVEYLGRYWEHL